MALSRNFWDELVELDRPLFDVFRPFGMLRPKIGYLPELTYMPAADVFSRNGDIVVRVELPGIDPEKDVKVTLEDGILDVKGERKEEKEIKEKGYYRKESIYGTFERRIPLPAGIKESAVKAGYRDGVLEVVVLGAAKTIPKAEAKHIPIHKKEALPAKR